MPRQIARYSVTNGMPGYMPNSNWGVYEWATRREMARDIKDLLRMLDAPACRFREVCIRRAWRYIQNWGSSTAHIAIDIGNGEYLFLNGLTEEEAKLQAVEE